MGKKEQDGTTIFTSNPQLRWPWRNTCSLPSCWLVQTWGTTTRAWICTAVWPFATICNPKPTNEEKRTWPVSVSWCYWQYSGQYNTTFFKQCFLCSEEHSVMTKTRKKAGAWIGLSLKRKIITWEERPVFPMGPKWKHLSSCWKISPFLPVKFISRVRPAPWLRRGLFSELTDPCRRILQANNTPATRQWCLIKKVQALGLPILTFARFFGFTKQKHLTGKGRGRLAAGQVPMKSLFTMCKHFRHPILWERCVLMFNCQLERVAVKCCQQLRLEFTIYL